MSISNEALQYRKFRNTTIRFSLRFNYILFPFDVIELVKQLAKTGYKITIPPPPKITPKNIRLTAKGRIAQKGDTEIELNDERGILAATSSSPELAIKCMNEVLQLMKNNLKVNLDEMAFFYELIGSFDIETDKNPLEIIAKINENEEYIDQFSKVLGENISNYTLRLVPRGQVPNQTEWFDVTIEPDVIEATSTYRTQIIFRSKEKIKVENFTQNLMRNITGIINIIEG